MKIEYKKVSPYVWECLLDCKVIAKIIVENNTNSWDLEEGQSKVKVFDWTNPSQPPIPGSPFSTLNQAKSVIEYHFRHLTEAQP